MAERKQCASSRLTVQAMLQLMHEHGEEDGEEHAMPKNYCANKIQDGHWTERGHVPCHRLLEVFRDDELLALVRVSDVMHPIKLLREART